VIQAGAGRSWQVEVFLPRIMEGNFKPGFFAEHFAKDLGIVLEECRRMNIVLPQTSHIYNMALELINTSDNIGELGNHAIIKVLERYNNIQVRDDRE